MLLSRSLKSVVLACALMAGGCDKQSEADSQPQADAAGDAKDEIASFDSSHAGEALPALTLGDAAGKTLDLASLKGEPVLLNLWATWCAPCIAELPTLDELAASGTVRVLTVSQDTQNTEKVAPFLEQRGLAKLEPWLDPNADLTFELSATTLPTTILYDANGKEVWRFTGENDWTSPESAEMIADAGKKQS